MSERDITDRLLDTGDRDAPSDAIEEINALRADAAAGWDKCGLRRQQAEALADALRWYAEQHGYTHAATTALAAFEA